MSIIAIDSVQLSARSLLQEFRLVGNGRRLRKGRWRSCRLARFVECGLQPAMAIVRGAMHQQHDVQRRQRRHRLPAEGLGLEHEPSQREQDCRYERRGMRGGQCRLRQRVVEAFVCPRMRSQPIRAWVAQRGCQKKRAGLFVSRWWPPRCAEYQAATRLISSAVAVTKAAAMEALRAVSTACTVA